ncbi:MAG: hypothetical protein WCK51_05945 [Armatimonadota bacterium]
MPEEKPFRVLVEFAKSPPSSAKPLQDLAPWIAAFIAACALLWSVWVRLVDLKWKRAETVRTLFTTARAEDQFKNAVAMLDVSGYELRNDASDKVIATIEHKDILPALAKLSNNYEDDDPDWERDLRIRECFDGLFEFMTELEFGLRANLFGFGLVEDRSKYWIECILRLDPTAPVVVKQYCNSTGFHLALAFMSRFSDFKKSL